MSRLGRISVSNRSVINQAVAWGATIEKVSGEDTILRVPYRTLTEDKGERIMVRSGHCHTGTDRDTLNELVRVLGLTWAEFVAGPEASGITVGVGAVGVKEKGTKMVMTEQTAAKNGAKEIAYKPGDRVAVVGELVDRWKWAEEWAEKAAVNRQIPVARIAKSVQIPADRVGAVLRELEREGLVKREAHRPGSREEWVGWELTARFWDVMEQAEAKEQEKKGTVETIKQAVPQAVLDRAANARRVKAENLAKKKQENARRVAAGLEPLPLLVKKPKPGDGDQGGEKVAPDMVVAWVENTVSAYTQNGVRHEGYTRRVKKAMTRDQAERGGLEIVGEEIVTEVAGMTKVTEAVIVKNAVQKRAQLTNRFAVQIAVREALVAAYPRPLMITDWARRGGLAGVPGATAMSSGGAARTLVKNGMAEKVGSGWYRATMVEEHSTVRHEGSPRVEHVHEAEEDHSSRETATVAFLAGQPVQPVQPVIGQFTGHTTEHHTIATAPTGPITDEELETLLTLVVGENIRPTLATMTKVAAWIEATRDLLATVRGVG